MVVLGTNVNIKLFLVVFPHIVLFRFEAKYKPGLKLNLDMGLRPDPTKKKILDLEPNPGLEGPAVSYCPFKTKVGGYFLITLYYNRLSSSSLCRLKET